MGLLEKLRGLLPAGQALIPREPITYRAIGVVRNHVREPRAGGWEEVRSDIIFRDELASALDGIEGFSHLIVVFHLDRVPDAAKTLRIKPGGVESEQGVLATRSQQRPNAIGIAIVRVVHRRKAVLRVRGLDALNGTPVLDVKPYLPPYDAVLDAVMPDWAVLR
jgi:tRNA-Thr(GGU) m(6)t(6)A37 methyltransferase TsaA